MKGNSNSTTLKTVKKRKLIAQENYNEIYEVENEETKERYQAETFYMEFRDYPIKSQIAIKKHINILQQLNFPSILKVYDNDEGEFDEEKRPSLLTEYCPNYSLEKVLKLNELSNTQKLIIMYGIAAGLDYLHSHDLNHFDLSPTNILIDEKFHPKICEIGYSKHFNGLKSMAKVKDISQYVAPEVVMTNAYSKESEVYSFALIAYEILTNKKPFGNLNPFQLLEKICGNHMPYLDDSIPKCYKDLLEKCWNFNPGDRLTFKEICKELRNNVEFLVNLEDYNEFENYVKEIDEFVDEFKPFDQVFDEIEIEENIKPKKKIIKRKKKGKKVDFSEL